MLVTKSGRMSLYICTTLNNYECRWLVCNTSIWKGIWVIIPLPISPVCRLLTSDFWFLTSVFWILFYNIQPAACWILISNFCFLNSILQHSNFLLEHSISNMLNSEFWLLSYESWNLYSTQPCSFNLQQNPEIRIHNSKNRI